MERKDGKCWFKRITGQELQVTDGERKLMKGTEEQFLAAQEQHDAMSLIDLGKRTGDENVTKVGQARIRALLGRQTLDDENLFSH